MTLTWAGFWSARGRATRFTAIDPKTLEWKWAQTGYKIALVRAAGERLLAASLFDGVVEGTGNSRPQRSNDRSPGTPGEGIGNIFLYH